jgi:hypothetical protein
MVRETYLLTKTMPNSWQTQTARLLCSLAVLTLALPLAGQTTASPSDSPYIGRTRAQTLQATGVQVSGDVRVGNGEMQLGNGSTITAGAETVPISLNRGGELRLCATTSMHLARDRSIPALDASGLMLGLDRGAIEARYQTGKYSDVLLTPDLRILISGPGEADLSIRVSRQGDTCIDNRGPNAPYITVTSQLEDGLYRVQPGQHVSFQHGSLREVIDTEHEPCGCPPPVSVASAGTPAVNGPAAAPGSPAGQPVGGPSSTPADTAFPLAVSEGLTPAPMPPTTPVAVPGEVHAQVAVPFRYGGELPTADSTIGPGDTSAATVAVPAPSPSAPAPVPSNMQQPPAPRVAPAKPAAAPVALPVATAVAPQPRAPAHAGPSRRFFRRVGHFFSRLFGAEQ